MLLTSNSPPRSIRSSRATRVAPRFYPSNVLTARTMPHEHLRLNFLPHRAMHDRGRNVLQLLHPTASGKKVLNLGRINRPRHRAPILKHLGERAEVFTMARHLPTNRTTHRVTVRRRSILRLRSIYSTPFRAGSAIRVSNLTSSSGVPIGKNSAARTVPRHSPRSIINW